MGSALKRISLVGVGLLAGISLLITPSQAQEPRSLIKEIQQRGELRVGYALAPGHSVKDSVTNQWRGIAVEIMEDWARELNVKHVAVDGSWDTMIAGLQARKYDVAAALNRRPPRALVVTFSMPYKFDTGVFALTREKVKALSWAELDAPGVKIAVTMGSGADKSLTRVAKKIQLIRFPDENEARMAVLAGRVDGFFTDGMSNALFAKENKSVRLLVPELPIQLEGNAYGIRKGYSYDDIQALDIEIESFINTGRIQLLLEKYGVPDFNLYTK